MQLPDEIWTYKIIPFLPLIDIVDSRIFRREFLSRRTTDEPLLYCINNDDSCLFVLLDVIVDIEFKIQMLIQRRFSILNQITETKIYKDRYYDIQQWFDSTYSTMSDDQQRKYLDALGDFVLHQQDIQSIRLFERYVTWSYSVDLTKQDLERNHKLYLLISNSCSRYVINILYDAIQHAIREWIVFHCSCGYSPTVIREIALEYILMVSQNRDRDFFDLLRLLNWKEVRYTMELLQQQSWLRTIIIDVNDLTS